MELNTAFEKFISINTIILTLDVSEFAQPQNKKAKEESVCCFPLPKGSIEKMVLGSFWRYTAEAQETTDTRFSKGNCYWIYKKHSS